MSVYVRLGLSVTAAMALGAAAPMVTSGHIATPTVDVTQPPPAPKIDLHIAGIAADVLFIWTGPSGQTLDQRFVGGNWSGSTVFQGYNTTLPSNGFYLAFNLYTQPGTWTLSQLNVCNDSLACSNYSGAPLQALFDGVALQVTNPNTPDIEAPVAIGGTIETPTASISKSPSLKALFAAKDDVSGIYSIALSATTPGNFTPIYLSSSQFASIPLTAAVKLTGQLQAGMPTGTYTINSIYLLDLAGNTSFITDAPTISKLLHGKTTIAVTP